MEPKKSVACTLKSCPLGCTIVTLGETTVHLSNRDFVHLVKTMLHHAWVNGLEVPAEAAERPLPVFH